MRAREPAGVMKEKLNFFVVRKICRTFIYLNLSKWMIDQMAVIFKYIKYAQPMRV